MTGSTTNPWVIRINPKPRADIRLFCFPHAGGGASTFYSWSHALRDQPIDICSIQLPGRENRVNEEPIASLDSLIEALVEAVRPFTNKPFAFFGHSMGSLIGYELARWLIKNHTEHPKHLFMSSGLAPDQGHLREPLQHLSDADFLTALQARYGAFPAAVQSAPELMDILLPIFRADIAVLENYSHSSQTALNTPITVYGGKEDPTVPVDALKQWQMHTKEAFRMKVFEGGHFYWNNHRSELLRDITGQLLPSR